MAPEASILQEDDNSVDIIPPTIESVNQIFFSLRNVEMLHQSCGSMIYKNSDTGDELLTVSSCQPDAYGCQARNGNAGVPDFLQHLLN